MKGVNRLSWVFSFLEKRYNIKYHVWSLGPATIVFAWGHKGQTPPSEMELSSRPYEAV